MTPALSPRLLAFVRSRVLMVEHDFSTFDGETRSHADQREGIGTYALTQAFFYAADLWVDRPPLVSAKALDYATQRWGDQASKVWTLKRAEIPRLDGCKISESGLIYEHVTTGGMFREFIQQTLREGAGTLDADVVALWLHENFQTAWVTREEDKELTRQGYKSRRGATLVEAKAVYARCGIEVVPRPQGAPTQVRVGDTVLVEETEEEREAQGRTGAGSKYSPFFVAVAEALRSRNSSVEVGHARDDYYASLKGGGPRGVDVVLVLEAPRGAKVRTPVVSLEAATALPGQEPTTPAWADLRGSLFGSEWRVSFGGKGSNVGRLCRCKRALAEAFDTSDVLARREAAAQTADQIVELWSAIGA
jgi:hypothetical protein